MKLRFLVPVLGILLLASCTSGTEGIFASIEREQKVVSLGGLNESATVYQMAEFNSKYYATGGKALFTRAISPNVKKWKKVSVNGKSGMEVAGVGSAGSSLYAVADGKLFETTDLDTWTKITLSAGDTAYSLVPVIDNDGVTYTGLLLVAKTDGYFLNVYRLTGGTTPDGPVALAQPAGWTDGDWEPSTEITSAVSDGTDIYVLNSNYVWQFNSGFTASAEVTTTGLPVSWLSGMLLSAGTLYVTTDHNGSNGGGIYKVDSADLSATSQVFTAVKTKVEDTSGYPVALAKMIHNDENDSIWVATGAATDPSTSEGSGYGEISTAGTFHLSPDTDSDNYESTVLPTSAVGAFFKGSDGTYFLGTVAHGLWVWDSSSKEWSQQ